MSDQISTCTASVEPSASESRERGIAQRMDIVAIVIILAILVVAAAVVVAALLWIWSRLRARDAARRIDREKLDAVAGGHREMAESHEGTLEELRPQALAHRQSAVDHTRKAEELEQRIERQERHARFHEERAAATEREREEV